MGNRTHQGAVPAVLHQGRAKGQLVRCEKREVTPFVKPMRSKAAIHNNPCAGKPRSPMPLTAPQAHRATTTALWISYLNVIVGPATTHNTMTVSFRLARNACVHYSLTSCCAVCDTGQRRVCTTIPGSQHSDPPAWQVAGY